MSLHFASLASFTSAESTETPGEIGTLEPRQGAVHVVSAAGDEAVDATSGQSFGGVGSRIRRFRGRTGSVPVERRENGASGNVQRKHPVPVRPRCFTHVGVVGVRHSLDERKKPYHPVEREETKKPKGPR